MINKMEQNWSIEMQNHFSKVSFIYLQDFLILERKHHIIYPPEEYIFEAFKKTPFDQVKVIILGQDPYHGPNQAHGLSFSVSDGQKIPPSLKNIFKELHQDLNLNIPENGNLEKWAEQGVLLLNATLTVRAHQAGSHQNKGWEEFTDAVIKKISDNKNGCVFLLWGNYAQKKALLIDSKKHLILKSVHPSPLSAHRGFLGNRHFSMTNDYLISKGIKPISWKLD